MDRIERLEHWKRIGIAVLRNAGKDAAARLMENRLKIEDNLFGYFECFRPDGAGVDTVFDGIAGGPEIVQRLLRIFEATKESFGLIENFIICRPLRSTNQELVSLTTSYFEKVRQIAIAYGDGDVLELLNPLPEICVVAGSPPRRSLSESFSQPEASIYELLGDWFRSLEPWHSDAMSLTRRATRWHAITELLNTCFGRYVVSRPTLMNLLAHTLNCGDADTARILNNPGWSIYIGAAAPIARQPYWGSLR